VHVLLNTYNVWVDRRCVMDMWHISDV